ncbi:hypothetical protein [Actinacidiphila yeochonensis]|uniref:hypothetical protein n=1 Tax=Actinacidiphila yeochonensis TaxID=89050 RepID=UPI000689C021|nr:hypothetical protein [Actinacidiphila yeochonensis]
MNEEAVGRILRESFPEVDANDPVAYVSELGDTAQALAYSYLFWPRLMEFEGAVFLCLWGDDEAHIRERMVTPAPGGSRAPLSWADAVDGYNYFELQEMFRMIRGTGENNEAAARELGAVLVESWRARLATAYPVRMFRVELVAPDESMGWCVAVAQELPELVPPAGWNPRRRAITGDSGS